ncbi:MAG: DNA primase [Ignavibacteriales bacterium]|nr:MAG: DNA primase [Ignavibacteriales bacterium]
MRIPESKIEEIRAAADIVDVISEYVILKKRGKNLLGLCPFHGEKTPSFTVSSDKQIYHCFGCHNGGNVFKFMMEYEKISFIEAVQELAEKTGIQLEFDDAESTEKQTEQELLYEINTHAAKYFSDNLLHDDNAEIAREYFANRKIKQATIRAFGLGYSFSSRDSFVQYATAKKIDLEKALYLGLIGSNNDGRLYDKFSGRIIFPLFSPNGRVIAFAGRILEDRENTAKYLNSPESLVYIKGRTLYGLFLTKDEIRKQDKAILVEGYMDLISLYQNGIKNVVAVSGTALTEDQVLLLSRYTKNVVLLFDADTAGIKASMRSIELLLKRDIEIKVVSLPAGEDPDSYVNNYGADKFEEIIDKGVNFLEYQTAYYEREGYFKDASTTVAAIRELVKPVALINDELKRNILIKTIAQKFGLREKLLESELDKIIVKQDDRNTKQQSAGLNRRNVSGLEQEPADSLSVNYLVEKELIKLLLEGNESIVELINRYITSDDYLFEPHRNLAEIIYNCFHDGESIIASSILEKISDEKLRAYLLEVTFEKYSVSKYWDELRPNESFEKLLIKIAIDTVQKFKTMEIDRKIEENHRLIRESTDELNQLELLKLNRELEQEKVSISRDLNGLKI